MSKEIEKKMIEELINLGKSFVKEAKETTEEFTKQKSLREMLDSSTKLKLKKASGNYASKEEMLKTLKTLFKEVEIEMGKIYVLTNEGDIYSFTIFKNGVDNNYKLLGAELEVL